ncbi:putative Uncharacterized MFS-type transporter [Glarea lozoyensis 74030]|uniref:Putative Uncharacterized MFS-type transporter n=1 Tax=Glarea lozoyensis (strain ATCC 74030 / MF5533) TaxID=1104152 RepID=H0EC82_GLAL7|nr:putative Uncharacterized MFS-type transporter [Glarea lozoyensis 74030]
MVWKRLYSIFPLKIVYLAAIALFELGSLVCGVAPSSVALIIGRAIAGLGSAGIFSGALLIIANSAPLHKRPAYTGMMSAMYGVASVAGPLLGGIMNIPLVLSVVVGAISSGGLVTVIGHYVPFMIASTVLMSVGEGLLTTFQPNTGHSKWIGYQVICGLGIGFGMQQPLIAVQVVLPMELVPAGTALLVFCQTLGASIFVSVAQNQFQNKLIRDLHRFAPSLDPRVVINAGATNLSAIVSANVLPFVVRAYNAIEWKSVKGKQIG